MDALKLIDIKFPRVSYDNGIYKMTSKMAMQYTDDVENFILENIIKVLPDDVTKLLLLDKKKVTEIFQKQIPKDPINAECPSCGAYLSLIPRFCMECGQALKWEVTP